jgi:hypothetical protein
MNSIQNKPHTMSPGERLQEVASLLAKAFLRMHMRKTQAKNTQVFSPSENLLSTPEESVHATSN